MHGFIRTCTRVCARARHITTCIEMKEGADCGDPKEAQQAASHLCDKTPKQHKQTSN